MKQWVLIVAVMLGLAGAPPLWAQSSPGAPGELGAVKADLERIKADLEDVKRQLAEVLRLMTQGAAQGAPTAPAAPVRASLGDVPVLGRPTAPVTLVEFSDYQCPFCQRFFQATLPALKEEYIDTGKVRYVFRDFPLDRIHPQARKAAEAAHCAGEQGKYWEMHDVLFGNQQALQPPKLSEHARALRLDGARFDQCLTSGTHAARVAQGLTDGQAAGVQGTPGFVVAKTTPGNSVEGALVVGAQPVEVFRRLIDQLLAEK
jgi:protein-disulfide isomerase